MDVGESVINDPLVEREKIIFPPLRIKLDLNKAVCKGP